MGGQVESKCLLEEVANSENKAKGLGETFLERVSQAGREEIPCPII